MTSSPRSSFRSSLLDEVLLDADACRSSVFSKLSLGNFDNHEDSKYGGISDVLGILLFALAARSTDRGMAGRYGFLNSMGRDLLLETSDGLIAEICPPDVDVLDE